MNTNNLILKGAYLSEPLNNVRDIKEGCRLWVLTVWCNGANYDRLFKDLNFWAKKEVVRQGFKH